MRQPKGPTLIHYERTNDVIHLTLKNLSNHELREVLIGLWCRLDAADRADHIKGLLHYSTDPDAYLSPVAAAIKTGDHDNESAIDLIQLEKWGWKIRP